MKQLLLQSEPRAGKIKITGKDFHYLIRVRRLKPGSSVPGLSPRGNRYSLTLEKISPDSCVFSAVNEVIISPIGEKSSDAENPPSYPFITLYQGLPKGSKMDMIVRMAIECGASRVTPLETQHCVAKLGGKAIESKLVRWRKIAKEAVQQSGATIAPQIDPPMDLSGIPSVQGNKSDSIGLFFHQEPLANSSLHGYLSGHFKNIALIIGPEGGFARNEVDLMLEKGFHPVHLGDRILRTETAGIYVLGAVQMIMLERGMWKLVV